MEKSKYSKKLSGKHKKPERRTATGEIDKRVFNRGKIKGLEPKDADIKVRLPQRCKDWLLARPEGSGQWVEDRIREAMAQEQENLEHSDFEGG